MRIDLHTHSDYSDGTMTPTQLVAQARRAGLDVVGLMDHDTTAGWNEAARAAVDAGIGLFRGTEVSCSSHGITVHLLSYLHDPENEAMAQTLRTLRENRDTRARRMTDKLSVDFPLTWEHVLAEVEEGATVGRPHLADAMVSLGLADDRSDAFRRYLTPRGPYYVHHPAIDPVDAVLMVREAGGVPVFAHPRAVLRGRVVSEDVIIAMTEAGLAGLEVDHRDNPPEEREYLRDLAHRLGLFVTGSSDYHGRGKPNMLGENLTSVEVARHIADEGAIDVVWGQEVPWTQSST